MAITTTPPVIFLPIAAAFVLALRRSLQFRRRVYDPLLRLYRQHLLPYLQKFRRHFFRERAVPPKITKIDGDEVKALEVRGMERRRSLETAFQSMRAAFDNSDIPQVQDTPKQSPKEVKVTKKLPVKKTNEKKDSGVWWYMLCVENWHGRLAALAFVTCFMREYFEPGHPSLVQQVHELVATPMFAHTPQVLVAIYSQIVDILT